jgi:hypothetical protein
MNLNAQKRLFYRLGRRILFSQVNLALTGILFGSSFSAFASPTIRVRGEIESPDPTTVGITYQSMPSAAKIIDKTVDSTGYTSLNGSATYLRAQVEDSTRMPPNTPSLPERTYIQWSGVKWQRMQIFIDTGQKGSARFRGTAPYLASDLLLQMPGDGSVQLMRYAGSGADWKWNVIEAHAVLQQPDQDTYRVEFDARLFASLLSAKIQFRFLDKDWNATTASKVLSWHPTFLKPNSSR